ncbi:site-specific integrase [Fluviispira vulneris]|uniref:site-specific integrase n=1 Tax=Fluviispira vulneris TaxID=2763012 RepID=UPI0016451CAD|nr:site-specific integrase [Fluviispira vulneris]
MTLENILELFLKSLQTKGASSQTLRAYKLDLLDYLKHLNENEFSEEATPL